MQYPLFPFNPGWPADTIELATLREHQKRLLAIMDERIDLIVSVMGVFKDDLLIYDGELPLGISVIEAIDTWLGSRIASLEGTTVDITLEPRKDSPLPRGPVYYLTPLAQSLCIDLGLLFVRVVMHNCDGYEWKIVAYKNARPYIAVCNRRNRHEIRPWLAISGAVAGFVEYGRASPMLRAYACALQFPPLK